MESDVLEKKVNAILNMQEEAYTKKIENELYKALNTLRGKSDSMYEKYAVDGIISRLQLRKYKRYSKIEKGMIASLVLIIKNNLRVIDDAIIAIYNEAFNAEAWAIDMATGFRLDWDTIDTTELHDILDDEFYDIAKDRQLMLAKFAVRTALNTNLVVGKTNSEMNSDIKHNMNKLAMAAILLLHTQLESAKNAGKYAAILKALEYGIEGDQIWGGIIDSKIRDSHYLMASQQAKKNKKTGMFTLPDGERTPYPGWIGLRARERCNCRCWIDFIITNTDKLENEKIYEYSSYSTWMKSRNK
jgi:hypothetical protein